MRSDRRARARGALVVSALLVACTPASMRRDLARVAELAAVQDDVLARTLDDEGEVGAGRDVERLLERPLDADTAVRIALLNNRELRARLHELGVARGMLIQARAVANPHVEVELLPERNSDLELAVEYEITSLVLAPLRAKAAEADLDAARQDVAGEVVELAQRVRVAVFALQAASQQLAIAQQALDAFAAGRDAAEAMLRAGNITPLDAAAQLASYERARVLVAKLELELADRRERVHALLGLHGSALHWRMVDALQPVPAEPPDDTGLERRAIAASLELGANRSRIRGADRRVRLARVDGWMPDVTLDVHALHAGSERAMGGEPWGVGGGIAVEVPLFDRGRGTIRARRSERDAAQERREGIAIDVRSASRMLRNHLRSAHARAHRYQEVILPAQRSVTEQTLLQYNAMQVGVFTLLQTRRDELELELAYVETLREYWSTRATFDALLAGRVVRSNEGVAPALAGAGSEDEGAH